MNASSDPRTMRAGLIVVILVLTGLIATSLTVHLHHKQTGYVIADIVVWVCLTGALLIRYRRLLRK